MKGSADVQGMHEYHAVIQFGVVNDNYSYRLYTCT